MQGNKKFKKLVRIIGVTVAVYGVFRYLLPLVTPFLFAWMTAIILKPSACAVAGRLKISWKGRNFGISPGAVGLLELVILIGSIGTLLYFGGQRLYEEAAMLAGKIPLWIEELDQYLTSLCRQMEGMLCLQPNTMVRIARDMIRSLGNALKQGAMPYLMGNSVNIAKSCIHYCILFVLYAIGVMLFLQEMDGWKERIQESLYQPEFVRIKNLLCIVANAYLRTQGIIMILTTIVCTFGFFLLGNPYYILAGVGIGLLDALPVFGTGTVLLPWTIFCFLQGKWGRGVIVFGIYLVCYFLREILEARLMGDKVGLTPLETLASIYIGLQLFGIFGFLLGPVGLLLVKEFGNG